MTWSHFFVIYHHSYWPPTRQGKETSRDLRVPGLVLKCSSVDNCLSLWNPIRGGFSSKARNIQTTCFFSLLGETDAFSAVQRFSLTLSQVMSHFWLLARRAMSSLESMVRDTSQLTPSSKRKYWHKLVIPRAVRDSFTPPKHHFTRLSIKTTWSGISSS